MKQTVPVQVPNRKAREERILEFDALADYANLTNAREDWRGFRQRRPQFFPDHLTEWIYSEAENWAEMIAAENWAEMVKKDPCLKSCTTPFLFYRDLLRAVWKGKDSDGNCLMFLLGFELDATKTTVSPDLDDYKGGPRESGEITDQEIEEVPNYTPALVRSNLIFSAPPPKDPAKHLPPIKFKGRLFEPNMGWKQATVAGLPSGRPAVNADGITCSINWKFGCQFQQAIYDLMQERWRAMACPQCEKYFIADKTAQRYCSTKCYGEKKQEEARDYYYRKGRAARHGAKLSRNKSHRKKS